MSSKCKFIKADGSNCRSFAIRKTDLCAAHSHKTGAPPGNDNALDHGFYSSAFTDDELARIAAYITNPNLDDELWLMRVINARIADNIRSDPTLPLETLIAAADALARGTGRIARLLKDKRALSGEAADGIAGAIAQVLDELNNEWGTNL